MTVGLATALGLFGLLIGSFLNVVIWRVPQGQSVVSPPSSCPGCGHRIRAADNVPVISWLVLRGRCRHCSTAISMRYPLVELTTGVLFALTVLRFGPSWELPAYLYLAAIGVALTWIDLDTHRLPNVIVLPSYGVLAVLLLLASALSGDWQAMLRAVVGGAALWGFYMLLAVLRPGGMGFGDVKLAGLLGGALGWAGLGPLVVGTFGAFLLGGLFAVGLLVTGRAGRSSGIPFGPWMIGGAAIGLGVGEQLWSSYLGLLTG